MNAGGVDTPPALAETILDRIEGFVEALRSARLDVSVDETATAVEAIECLELADREALYWGLRMCLVSAEPEITAFDRVFREYWLRERDSARDASPEAGDDAPAESSSGSAPPSDHDGADGESTTIGDPHETSDPGAGEPESDRAAPIGAYSAVERLREKNFADFRDEDYRQLTELLEHLDLSHPRRLSRRRRAARRGTIDARRTMISSFQTGGYPIKTRHRSRSRTPRRIVFVCDVSGSMQTYAVPMLMFAHAMTRLRGAVSTFAFATRLHAIDFDLNRRDPREALLETLQGLVDWSGGTRVGDCLEALNREHAQRMRGAVVVIASDGWDLGDVDQLRAQMDRLRLLAHEILWLNPNLQDRDFEPLTKGMANALPFIDELLSCHQYANLELLLARLAAISAR